jgi:HK97 family phage major capsid protein
MSDTYTVENIDGKIAELTSKVGDLAGAMREAKDHDAEYVEAKAKFEETQTQIASLWADKTKRERDAEIDAAIARSKELQSNTRLPSKAHLIGNLGSDVASEGESVISLIAQARSRDASGQTSAKAKLAEMGVEFAEPNAPSGSYGKATLGETDANGGYLLPREIVQGIIETKTATNMVRQLLTVIPGVRSDVLIPYEGTAPARAVIQTWGEAKENVNFTVGAYTASLVTIARIIDVGNQFLKRSGGAAEALVRSKLGRAFALGENYYVLQGAGGSDPMGILTSLGTVTGTFVSDFTGNTPADNSLPGSIAAAIAVGGGALAARDREAQGVIMNGEDYWRMLRQGTDEAGFFFAPVGGPNDIRPGTLMSPFGVPIVHSSSVPTDDLVVGEFKSLQLFEGDQYRVDTSDVAGDRWDKNLTGFRGEEEIAFNADPYVAEGLLQRVRNIHA